MKEYAIEDLQVLVDPIPHMRKNPKMYLRGAERPTGEFLAAAVMSGLIWLGALPARVSKIDNWWVISSEHDWLSAEHPANVDTVFARMFPFPEAGVNSYRPEILLSAFADAIVTFDAAGARWIKGDSAKFRLPADIQLPKGGRVVVFAL